MTQPVYSDSQHNGHTDIGVTAEMPRTAAPNTPDVAGTVGPAVQSEFPWPGRAEAACVAFDGSAQAFSSILTQAQQSPGTTVTSGETASAPNAGPGSISQPY